MTHGCSLVKRVWGLAQAISKQENKRSHGTKWKPKKFRFTRGGSDDHRPESNDGRDPTSRFCIGNIFVANETAGNKFFGKQPSTMVLRRQVKTLCNTIVGKESHFGVHWDPGAPPSVLLTPPGECAACGTPDPIGRTASPGPGQRHHS